MKDELPGLTASDLASATRARLRRRLRGGLLHVVLASVIACLALRNAWLLAMQGPSDATPALGLALFVLTPLTILSICVHLFSWRQVRPSWDSLDGAIQTAEVAALVGIVACLFL